MPDPSQQSESEIHEATEALKEIAEDVEAERAQAGRATSLPHDDPEGDDATREDHVEGAASTFKDAEDLEVGVFASNFTQHGGPQR